MKTRIQWMAFGLMAIPIMVAQHAYAAAPATTNSSTRPQTYRCQDASGLVQYQQQACAEGVQQHAVNVSDDRTPMQTAQAKRMAERDQDLAKHLAYVHRQQDRRSIEATSKARPLTAKPHQHVAQAPASAIQTPTVIPRKRDFRAVSAKTEKRRKHVQPQPTAAGSKASTSLTSQTL